MNQLERLNISENSILPGTLTFSEAVTTAYEAITPVAFDFSWSHRVDRFIRAGIDNLWNQFNQARVGERVVYGGLAAVGAYTSYRILRSALEGFFGLGTWLLEKVNNIRRDSLQLILSLTLGTTVIGLIPLLYQGIARGNLSLTQVFTAWDEGSFEGLLELLTQHFPDGVRAMSAEVSNFIRETIGVERFDVWFGDLNIDRALSAETLVPSDLENPVTPEETMVEAPILVEVPDISFTPSVLTRERWSEFIVNPSVPAFTFFINSLVENEGGVVVREGRIWLADEVGKLFDLSRWLTFQYGAALGEVIEAGENDPEAFMGAYIVQYLRETPKFIVLASSLEFLNLLRGRHASLFIRPVITGLTWGAWPIRLVGAAASQIGGTATFARFTRDGVVFLTRSGINLAKLTGQGSVLIWQGGRFVAAEAVRQVSRVATTRALGSAIMQTYTRTIGRQVTHFTSRTFTNRLLTVAGWRGAAASAMWADDATVIGVLDDIVAVGLSAWLATDVYHLIQITRSAFEFRRLMTEQESLEITQLTALDESTQVRLEALEAQDEVNDDQAFEFLSTLPRAEFRITRENGFHEEYLMVRGQILAVKIFEGDTELASFSEGDIETLSQELPPPVDFTRWSIDYHLVDEELFAHYRLAFTYILNETGWGALDYNIIDNRTLEIKRRDSQQVVFLHRDGENWYIGADRTTSFDLFQAISMANLINRVETLLLAETRLPAGETPFYAQADGLYISRPGFDTTLLEGEEDSWYHQFYQGQLGLNPDTMASSLNRHYQSSIRPQLREQIDAYMQDFIPG